MSEQPVHFTGEFTLTPNGALTVEQDSPEDVASCIFRTAVCAEGFREDLPAFGVPELAFQTIPLDLPSYEAALEFWEPRATLETAEEAEALNQAHRRVRVEVGAE
jgi:hypothetical protein